MSVQRMLIHDEEEEEKRIKTNKKCPKLLHKSKAKKRRNKIKWYAAFVSETRLEARERMREIRCKYLRDFSSAPNTSRSSCTGLSLSIAYRLGHCTPNTLFVLHFLISMNLWMQRPAVRQTVAVFSVSCEQHASRKQIGNSQSCACKQMHTMHRERNRHDGNQRSAQRAHVTSILISW